MALPAPAAAPNPNEQFDYQRQKAAQSENAQLQQQREAIRRRGAAMGGGPGGALIKQEQLAADSSGQRLAQANEGINVAQSAEDRRIRELQQAQQYQTSERLGSQGFTAEQAAMQRKYGTSERLGSQEFTSGQNAIQTRLAEAGLTGTYNGQDTLAKTQADKAANQWQQTFDYTKGNDQKEYDVNVKNNIAAQIQNLKTAGYNPDQIGQILHNLGLDQLGVDGLNIGEILGVTKAAPVAAKPGAAPGGAAGGPQTTTYMGNRNAVAVQGKNGQISYVNAATGQRIG